MNIWLAYVNYPITTASYLLRALQTRCRTTTIGPRLPAEMIESWGLQKMQLPLAPLDIDTGFTPDMAAIWSATAPVDLPDLYLWVESVGGYRPGNLTALRCPKACYLIDTHYHLEQSCAIAQDFDYVFIAQLIDLEAMRQTHPRVYWLPLACDPGVHTRYTVPKQWDIGFVGSMNSRREAMLAYLSRHVSVHRERSFWHDMARTFSASRIILNDASFDDLNMRFFEALGSGSLLLSNRTNGSAQDILFQEGAEYICHDEQNLLELVQRYLADEPLREAIAAQGRQRVLAAHTYRHRVDDLLDVLLHGKPDTFTADELRERSLEVAPVNSTAAASRKIIGISTPHENEDRIVIQSVITARATKSWPTWQMIHEWETWFAQNMGARFKALSPACMVIDLSYRPGMYDLIFLPLADMLRYYEENYQIIPIVMDLWQQDFDLFRKLAPKFRLVFVTSLQVFNIMRAANLTNVRYLPFSLADNHLEIPQRDKAYDIIQFGRRNQVLDDYMAKLLERHPQLSYITTEVEANTVYFCSNHSGKLHASDTRTTFMQMLASCKICLVHSPGMDDPALTGGIMPVSPRFLESIAAGCHLVGRIPDHDEFDLLGIRPFCHHVDDFDLFEQTVLGLLRSPPPEPETFRSYLRNHSSTVRASQLRFQLEHQQPAPDLSIFCEVSTMSQTPPRTHIQHLLTALRASWSTFPRSARMDACQTLCSVIGFYDEFWQMDLYDLMGEIISLQESPSDILLFAALELKYRGVLAAARQLACRAKELDPGNLFAAALHANLLREEGVLDSSRACCLTILQTDPKNEEAQAILTMCDVAAQMLPIEHYHILHRAHTMLQPRSYLEIGVSSGKSLAMAGAETTAAGVDPLTGALDQQLFHSPARQPHLFKLTSNDFFQQGLIQQLFPHGQFDMAFIDGLHLFEQALMDFVNLEQFATPDSVIFIHDCLPINAAVAARKRETTVWTGDVWKVIPILKAIRPDLEIITFPVSPSGLAMVRRLDPKSRVLVTQFDSITAHFFDLPLPENMEERFRLLNVTNADPAAVLQELHKQQGTYHKGETLQ